MTHAKILKKASKALAKDEKKYSKEAKSDKGMKKKHDLVEKREAAKASKVTKKMAKGMHEY